MKHRGVAMVLLGYEQHWLAHAGWWQHTDKGGCLLADFSNPTPRRWAVCRIPRELRYQVMLTKAYAFCDGWYSAEMKTQRELHLDAWYNRQRTIPPYDAVKWRVLDGDGFDDENVESGDYILACRIALELTKERYQPYEERR